MTDTCHIYWCQQVGVSRESIYLHETVCARCRGMSNLSLKGQLEMKLRKLLLLPAAMMAFSASQASADDIAIFYSEGIPTYYTDTITFEQWCIERYDMERCQEAREGDLISFGVSRKKIEQFETDYFNERRKRIEFRQRFVVQDDLVPNNRLNKGAFGIFQ